MGVRFAVTQQIEPPAPTRGKCQIPSFFGKTMGFRPYGPKSHVFRGDRSFGIVTVVGTGGSVFAVIQQNRITRSYKGKVPIPSFLVKPRDFGLRAEIPCIHGRPKFWHRHGGGYGCFDFAVIQQKSNHRSYKGKCQIPSFLVNPGISALWAEIPCIQGRPKFWHRHSGGYGWFDLLLHSKSNH